MISVYLLDNGNPDLFKKEIEDTKNSLLNGSNNNLFDISIVSMKDWDIKQAYGKYEWILFVRPGTIFYAKAIDTIVSYIAKYSFIPLFYSGFDVLSKEKIISYLPLSYDTRILNQTNIIGNVFTIKKSLWAEIKIWDFNKQHDYFKRFAQQHMFMSIPQNLALIRELS